MALSGSNTGTKVSGYSLRIDWSATQNKAANTSTITATAYLVIDSGWNLDINSRTGVITIDGTNYTISYHLGYKGAGTHKLGEASKTITHNTDGTKSFVISGSAKIDASITNYGWVGTLSKGNDTYTLDAIPRYAAITAFSASINDLTASLSWTADKTISQWRWSSNSGSSYSAWTNVSASNGSTSVSVSPGSTYGFRIQVKNSASSLITTSSTLSRTATKTPSTLRLSTTSQNVGSKITWTIKESYTQYNHKITYAFGNTSGYILGSSTETSTALTANWTVPTALANQIPNATSGTGTIYVYTYYGSVHVGTNSYTFTAKVPNDTTRRPSVPSITVSHVGSRPSGTTSYVQGRSQVRVVSSSTAQGGASISSYRVVVSGIGTYYGSNITSGYLTNAETVTITVRATDSRGYYRENSTTIKVEAYSPPTLTTYTATRHPDDESTLAASINFSISPIGNKNTKRYRIRYRSTADEEYTPWMNSTAYYTRNITHTATGVLDPNKSYEIEFHIEDYYESVTRTMIVGTAFTLMDFHANGKAMAIGKVSEDNGFEVGMPTTIFNTEPDILKLKRSSPFANVNLVFENDVLTRYVSFSAEGRPRWNTNADVNHPYGFDFWTQENSDVITESGSNSNGRYIKFSDGTLIMTVTTTAALAWSKAVTATVTMPSSTTNASYQVQLSYAYDLPDAIRGKVTVHARNKTTSSFGIVMQTQDNFFNTTNAPDVRIDCVIYARWK